MKRILLAFFCLLTVVSVQAQTLPGTYTKTSTVTGLQYPSDFDWLPDGRYIITQKGGTTSTTSNAMIKLFKNDGSAIGTFYNLTDSVDANGEHGLHGVAVDPDFNNNHYIYVYYTYINKAKTVKALRVVRFTEANNVGTNPTTIFNQVYTVSTPNHVGGIIRVRASKLYIEIGELAYMQTDPSKNFANKLTNPYGKVLRINLDGSIPTDNPFYDDGNPETGKDDRIWSYGHRNSFGMCINPVTDSLFASENGLNAWDEFNIIHKGGNYGWATCEGEYTNSSTTVLCSDPTFVKPIATWPSTGGKLPAVTGCLFYSGTVMPEFDNHILVADNSFGILYDLTMGNAPAYDVVTNKKAFADITTEGLTTIRQGADGCIYALKGGYTTTGEIFKICHKATGIHPEDELLSSIGQNYPNPAAANTLIDYRVVQTSRVIITLVDVAGRTVRTLNDALVQAGKHTLEVNDLSSLPNGSYFYKMEVLQNNKLSFSQTKRMIVIN